MAPLFFNEALICITEKLKLCRNLPAVAKSLQATNGYGPWFMDKKCPYQENHDSKYKLPYTQNKNNQKDKGQRPIANSQKPSPMPPRLCASNVANAISTHWQP